MVAANVVEVGRN